MTLCGNGEGVGDGDGDGDGVAHTDMWRTRIGVRHNST